MGSNTQNAITFWRYKHMYDEYCICNQTTYILSWGYYVMYKQQKILLMKEQQNQSFEMYFYVFVLDLNHVNETKFKIHSHE